MSSENTSPSHKAPTELRTFESLLTIIATLRGPDGCPWDKKQTIESLAKFTLEEAYEYLEAVESKDTENIKDELGDILLQVVLNSQVAKDNSDFDVFDVIENLNEKLVRRHPHVFQSVDAKTSEEVEANWEKIKASEKKSKKEPVFQFTKAQPSLMAANEIGRKSKKWKFDWTNEKDVYKKVLEEIEELREAMTGQLKDELEHEVGDVLFSMAQLSRHLGIDPEQALRKTNQRFQDRFEKMQEIAETENKDFVTISDEEREDLWTKAKKTLK